MMKTLTAAAIVGALSLASVPAFAQSAAAPEPPKGAQPMDNPAAGASSDKASAGEKGKSMEKSSMSKGSMMKKKKGMKHKKAM